MLHYANNSLYWYNVVILRINDNCTVYMYVQYILKYIIHAYIKCIYNILVYIICTSVSSSFPTQSIAY